MQLEPVQECEGIFTEKFLQKKTFCSKHSCFLLISFGRLLNLARDYAQKRRAFGKLLIQHPLHVQTLARMDVEARACFLLSFEASNLIEPVFLIITV